MTDIWVPSKPAFEGLHLHEVSWQAVDGNQTEKIRRICGFEGSIERMVCHQTGPRGYYRVLGYSSYFLKVTDQVHVQRQLESDQIGEYLAMNGINVNSLVSSFPKSAAGLGDVSLSMLAYPYLNANFIQPNSCSLSLLGEAIGRLHLVLSEAPFAEQVKTRGLKRHQALIKSWHQNTFENIKDHEVRQVLAQSDKTLLSLLVEDAQCVHGDLNYGNIMLDDQQQIVFLDFEDAQSAWFNPLKDLAFVVERFILIHQPQDMGLQLNALLASYYRIYKKTFDNAEHLVRLLQALAVRSLLILAEVERQGCTVAPSEWEKFVFLYKMARKNQSLLKDGLCKLTLK